MTTNARATGRRAVKAVIPAAGLATRFLPATKAVPKELLPVVDRPVLQYIVEEAAAAGLTGVLLVTGGRQAGGPPRAPPPPRPAATARSPCGPATSSSTGRSHCCPACSTCRPGPA